MRSVPALDVRDADCELLLAAVDDFSPTAVEERPDACRIFFSTAVMRDAARAALAGRFETVASEVPDEDWAVRSQRDLTPITVGRITISAFPNPNPPIPNPC